MEFILGIVVLAFISLYLAVALRNPNGRTDRVGRYAFIGCQLMVFALTFVDWVRGELVLSPIDLAADGYALVIIPGALSLIQLLLFLQLRWDAIWMMFGLSVLEFVTFIPALILVEETIGSQGKLVSFLSTAPIAALILATLAPFLAVPAVTQKIPESGSRLWNVAFRCRIDLLEGLKQLAQRRHFEYAPARSILEAGSAHGQTDGIPVTITTQPTLFPFRYAVRVFVAGSNLKRGVDLRALQERPWYGKNVEFRMTSHSLQLTYRSSRAIPLNDAELGFVVDWLCANAAAAAGAPEAGRTESPDISANIGKLHA